MFGKAEEAGTVPMVTVPPKGHLPALLIKVFAISRKQAFKARRCSRKTRLFRGVTAGRVPELAGSDSVAPLPKCHGPRKSAFSTCLHALKLLFVRYHGYP